MHDFPGAHPDGPYVHSGTEESTTILDFWCPVRPGCYAQAFSLLELIASQEGPCSRYVKLRRPEVCKHHLIATPIGGDKHPPADSSWGQQQQEVRGLDVSVEDAPAVDVSACRQRCLIKTARGPKAADLLLQSLVKVHAGQREDQAQPRPRTTAVENNIEKAVDIGVPLRLDVELQLFEHLEVGGELLLC